MKTLSQFLQPLTISRISRLWLAVAVCLFLAVVPLQAQDDPTLINIIRFDQIDAMRYDLNGDGTVDDPANATAYSDEFGTPSCTGGCEGYELRRTLDFAGTKWENPTGGTTSDVPVVGGWNPIQNFTAIFEGNNNTISNIFIDRTTVSAVGLFGAILTGGEVRNLKLVGGSVKGMLNVGCLAGGLQAATLRNCSATGSVEATAANANAGGLVGTLLGTVGGESTVRNCSAIGNVEVTAASGNVGGLAGE